MATRIQEPAPATMQQAQIIAHQFLMPEDGGEPMPGSGSRFLRPVSEERAAEVAPMHASFPPFELVSRQAWAVALYRCMDVTIAVLCLLALWPVMVGAAVLVLVSSRGPIFYSQPRFGYHGEIFGCLKFRTMEVDADRRLAELLRSSPAINELWARDRKLRDDPRITTFGGVLRRYSIDELPQLFNVLRGEMSIVGPRPLALDEAHFYGDAFAAYCSLKPGITGPWQISGRNQISFLGRARLDCEYARSKCVRRDVEIVLRTIPVVLRGTGF